MTEAWLGRFNWKFSLSLFPALFSFIIFFSLFLKKIFIKRKRGKNSMRNDHSNHDHRHNLLFFMTIDKIDLFRVKIKEGLKPKQASQKWLWNVDRQSLSGTRHLKRVETMFPTDYSLLLSFSNYFFSFSFPPFHFFSCIYKQMSRFVFFSRSNNFHWHFTEKENIKEKKVREVKNCQN